jgi:phosphomevalonate kinase
LVRGGPEVWVNETEVSPFSLPRGIQLMLADICGGSVTTSMVRVVRAWKEKDPVASASLWGEMAQCNTRVEKVRREAGGYIKTYACTSSAHPVSA